MRTQIKKNEEIILIIRKHWFVLIPPVFWTLVFLLIYWYFPNPEYRNYVLLIAGASFIWLFYRIYDRSSNLWAVTNYRVIDEYGVFSRNSKETPLDKINNVSYRQSLSGRIFNYGNVQIQSAAEAGSTIHKMIQRPRLLKDTITEYQELNKEEQIREQAKGLANAVSGNKSDTQKDIAEEITKLHELMLKGIITEEEFQRRKNKILNS